MPLAPTPLRGHVVALEPLAPSHEEALYRAARRVGDTGLLTSYPRTLEATARYIAEAVSAQRAGRALPYATISLASGEVVGSTRFCNIELWDWPDGRAVDPARPHVVEIGWTWLARDAQRTAINTEAKWLMLTHAFETLGVERVTLKTDARNARSRAAIERIGASFEGVVRRQMPAADGGVRDTALYSIIAPEWPAVREALRAKVERALGG